MSVSFLTATAASSWDDVHQNRRDGDYGYDDGNNGDGGGTNDHLPLLSLPLRAKPSAATGRLGVSQGNRTRTGTSAEPSQGSDTRARQNETH
jgi:hypothetical protein